MVTSAYSKFESPRVGPRNSSIGFIMEAPIPTGWQPQPEVPSSSSIGRPRTCTRPSDRACCPWWSCRPRPQGSPACHSWACSAFRLDQVHGVEETVHGFGQPLLDLLPRGSGLEDRDQKRVVRVRDRPKKQRDPAVDPEGDEG